MDGEKKLLITGGLITLALLVGGYFFAAKQDTKSTRPLMGEAVKPQGATHVKHGEKHPAYNTNPPTSGWHWADAVAGPGVHEEEIVDELQVHSLEHGAVIVSYRADLPKNQVKKIKEAYDSASGKKILAPRKGLDGTVALTSWERILKLKTIDQEKIKEFIETNTNRAPEDAPI